MTEGGRAVGAASAGVRGELLPGHMEWLSQGGADPVAPTLGEKKDLRIIDYRQPSRENLRDEIAAALRDDGVFALVNHSVPPACIATMLHTAKDFFAGLRACEGARRDAVVRQIGMNMQLRPMTKAARGLSDFEEEALNAFLGPDQKITFDYALQNDAARIGRCRAFAHEEAALHRAEVTEGERGEGGGECNRNGDARLSELRAQYHRARTCAEHLGQNLWPAERPSTTVTHPSVPYSQASPTGIGGLASWLPFPLPFAGVPADPETERAMAKETRALTERLRHESEADAIAPHGFREICEAYLNALLPLSRDLLTLILEGAGGLSPPVIEEQVAPLFQNPLVVNRLLSYPPQRLGAPPWQNATPTSPPSHLSHAVPVQRRRSMSCGAHVDYGALTLIAEDHGRALEVERRGHQHPRDVTGYEYLPPLPPGALVVSTGYMLEKLTNGRIPATRHRVQNLHRPEAGGARGREKRGAVGSLQGPRGEERTALAFFLDPHPEAFIAPLDACIDAARGEAPRYAGCVAGAKGVRFGDPRYIGSVAERSSVIA